MSKPKETYQEEISEKLAEWQQGDFSLDCGDFVYGDLSDDGETLEAYFEEGIIGYAVVSQTCDIVRDPNKSDIKNVSVCPLVKIISARLSDIEKGQAPRFGLLQAVPKNTVVDFSRVMSISKKLLVKWDRKRGCLSEKDQIEFAYSLKQFFGRYAFPDGFNDSLSSFQKAVKSKYAKDSDLGKTVRSIRELRVYPHSDWNNSECVPITFIVILEDDDVRELKDTNTISKLIKSKIDLIKWIKPYELHERAIHMAKLSDLTAAEYLNSFPLDLNALSYAKRYN